MTSAEIADRLRQALGSQYEIGREIGRGGMATVFLAEDLKHGRAVALKVLSAELAESLGAERFRREIATSAKLQHPHILTVLDSGETSDGLLWFTMPYVDGESLRARLERERQLPLEDAVGITREVALALDYAHGNGVVHRDIKPENILLTRDRQALVADFGIARALTPSSGRETLTATGMSVGTPAYMSPEQAAGDRTIDARSDIYSLGAVCYEMLVGEPPFTGPTAQAILAKVLSGETPSVRRSRPAVPEGVDAGIRRALAPVPADRFASATQLANALEASLRAGTAASRGVAESVAPSGRSLAGSRRMRPAVAFLGLGFLLGIGALFAWRARNGTPGAKVASLAVMPFANGAGDANTEYLSDGLTESLIASLTHVPGLRVKSRSSVFHYKGKDVDIEKAGTALGVPALVTGRVVPRGDSVEVSAELVEVRDNTELWGQRYGGKSADIITIEERIAGDLAAALRGSLTDSAKQQVTRAGTRDREAYELYLRGRYAWNKRTLSDIRSSIAYFDQAIAKDPGYAQAYSGLADAYVVLPQYFDTSSDDIPKADAAARKALELDPALAHPHAVLGVNDMEYHWDFATGEAEFKRAFALDESDATAHQWYAECLALLGGREEEAIAENERARGLDPLSPIISASGGDVLIRARRFDESVARLRTVLAEYPTFAMAHEFLAEAYFGKRMYPEAIAEYVTLDSLSRTGLGGLSDGFAMQRAYRAGGERAALRTALAFQRDQWRKGLTPPYFVATAAADLGERDEAFRWLDSAYKARFWLMVGLKTDYQLDSLRSDPRFAVLVRKIGLP